MEANKAKGLVAETGLMLVEKGLVARTWGNISCRVTDRDFAISPSGMSYARINEGNVPIFHMDTGEYDGSVKPSSEKKIHAAAYETFPDVNFVIHTHQDFATAAGLVGADSLVLTPEEKELLGEIRVAGYGLPGTKTLKANVAKELAKGSKVILMIHHGALICGKDRDDAMAKALALEEVCKRAVSKAFDTEKWLSERPLDPVCEKIRKIYPNLICVSNEGVIERADAGEFTAQTDDMAQMIGGKLKSVPANESDILKALSKQDAVLVRGVGALVKADEDDDAAALALLVKKAVLAKKYTEKCGVNIKLSGFDCTLMRTVYKMKYSKKK